MSGSRSGPYVYALADHGSHDPLVLQNADGALGCSLSHAVGLHHGLDAREGPVRRYLARFDHAAQQGRQLKVDRRTHLMIDRHMITLSRAWDPDSTQGSVYGRMSYDDVEPARLASDPCPSGGTTYATNVRRPHARRVSRAPGTP